MTQQVVSRLSRPLGNEPGRDGAEKILHVLPVSDRTVPPLQLGLFTFRIAATHQLNKAKV